MQKDSDITITCCQCGKEFLFSKDEQDFYGQEKHAMPRRCKECRSQKQDSEKHVVCSRCGAGLENGNNVYCATCVDNNELEFEIKTRNMQAVIDEEYTKLKKAQAEKKDLEDALCQQEHLMRELEMRVDDLSRELERSNQLYTTLNQWFQPTLNGIEERMIKRLETLENGQNTMNERITRMLERTSHLFEKITLLELIKRSLRDYHRHTTKQREATQVSMKHFSP